MSTTDGGFKSDPTSSNRAGVTLMNNQVGYVVAEVMREKDNVDGRRAAVDDPRRRHGQIDFDFEEIAEALGWADFGNDDFEEIMSTHYGRMVVLDDRVLHVRQPRGRGRVHRLRPPAGRVGDGAREESTCTRRTARSTSSSTATLHFWDASPENWVKGQEQYAKGWIECFHAYQGLGPPETHWPLEKFQKYSEEDFVKDVFEDGYVDVGVFESTYLKEWYTDGFNTIEHNAGLAAKHPGKLITNGRWDPREGEAGLRQLEEDAERYGLKGVKLYTAEWHSGSRGWKLNDPEAQPFLEKCQELGIINIHVHKGPTIWPLDKDAFDVKDIDDVATSYPGAQLHRRARGAAADRGLLLHGDAGAQRLRRPRGRHRRPDARPPALLREGDGRAAVLGRRGQDAVRQRLRHLGAQVAGRGAGRLGLPGRRGFSDYPAFTTAAKKKILGLNAAKLYGVDVPPELQLPDEAGAPAARDDARSWSREPRDEQRARPRGARDGLRPRARRADHLARVRQLLRRVRRRRRGRCGCGCRRRSARRTSRTSWWPTRATPCAGCRGSREVTVVLEDHYTGEEINARRRARARGSRAPSPARPEGELDSLRELFLRKALLARQSASVRGAARRRARPPRR